VCGIVRACHERWDGRAIPDQKAGEEIPLEARIIFACDAFHAMTTDRPYRRALPSERRCAAWRRTRGRNSTRGSSTSACACSTRRRTSLVTDCY
jgi:HD-GYP domain-containing protein (c-di-GMP phosphodiesterase class II)